VTLLRPRWIAGHLLVLVLTVSFVFLGFWQLARNNHKQALVREARARYAAPAPDIASTAPEAGARAQASGTYADEATVLLRNQVHGSAVGVDVLNALVLDDGSAVIVDRGWVAATGSRSVVDPVLATTPVAVRGVVHASSALGPQDTVERNGDQLSLPRVDLARIGRVVPYRLRPYWIEAQSQDPGPARGAPALPRPPAPDQVNHTQYAIEWFAFAAIGIIGWPIALYAFSKRRGGFSTADHADERDDAFSEPPVPARGTHGPGNETPSA
jgi:cytochrome oxidase assembly protein ShyY1